jgi:hypothetical protein
VAAEGSAYGAAFSKAVRRIAERAEGQDALATKVAAWLAEAFELDGETARAVVAGVMR